MNSIDLYVDNCEFYSGGQKWESVWGNIYFRMNDLCFPDSEWYDKVSSLLEMWMGAIIEFIQYDKRECTLHFMDGPFYIHIRILLQRPAQGHCRLNRSEFKE